MGAAAEQAWPAFVLVTGLLLVGVVAHADGLFEALAGRVVRLPGPVVVLYLASLALVAVVTAVLNLDTAVVFLTPILIHAARQRSTDERPFLYGAVFMANASSLFLPGSNLTNLIVLEPEHVSGGEFFARMLPGALAAAATTALLLCALHRRRLRGDGASRPVAAPLPLGLGLAGTVIAAVLVVVSPEPALPVLGLGLVLAGLRVAQGRVSLTMVLRTVNPQRGGAHRAVPPERGWRATSPDSATVT